MLNDILLTTVSLLVAYNPISKPLMLLSLTKGMGKSEIKKTGDRSTLLAFIIAVVVVLFGNLLLNMLGIRLSSVRIAGGIILCIFGIRFSIGVFKPEKSLKYDVAAVPLATPLVTGPVVISTLLVSTNQYGVFVTLAALIPCIVVVWVFFRFSEKIVLVVGERKLELLSRLMGMLLLALGVQMMRNGLTNP
ncbi:MAG: MarC family protein [Candidatus Micrarchaeia archaeon]